MENRKSRKSTFLYVILLTLCVPLAYVYLIIVTGLLDKIQEGHIGLTLMIVFLPLLFYWGLVAVVGIINIGQSFKIYKTGNPIECVNRMLIHKYGLVVFFCVNFLVLFIYYFFISMAVLVGSRGAAIIFAPVLLPWLIGAVVFFGWCNMACYFTGKLLWNPGNPYDLQKWENRICRGSCTYGIPVFLSV